MLVAGAGLLVTTFVNLRAVPPGFDPTSVVTVPISIPGAKYADAAARRRFVASLVGPVESIPGVSAAGVVNAVPLSGDNSSTTITIEGVPFVDGPNRPNANDRPTTPGYLEALRIPLLRGRPLSDRDRADTPFVALINETMAARFWPGQDPIGRRFKRGRPQSHGPWITVVGIVADIRHSALREPPRQEMYVPFDQAPEDFVVLAVRSSLSPEQLRKPLQTAMLQLDPDIPLTNLRPLTETVQGSLAMSRFETMLMASFAVVALLLAAGGIYGVTSYAVAQRTREFGIRVALGAGWRDVAGLVLRQAVLIAAIGVTIGIGGAAAATRVMRSLLFGVSPGDPVILAATAGGLTAILLVACLVPAQRAASVDPVIALRGE
jgi:putative ABC transport system permease protein